MQRYWLTRLADHELIREVTKLVSHERQNTADLLAAAAGRTRAQIAELLAERFPRPDAPTRFALTDELALGAVGESSATSRSAPGRINFAAAEQMAATEARVVSVSDRIADRGKLTPLSTDRVALQVTLARGTAEQLRYAQALLGYAIAPGDVAAVLDRALAALVEQLEKRRFAKCARASTARSANHDPRHIPAQVRREVFERDGGRCSFVSADGHACESQRDLEFDHHVPVARGGVATAANIRLRCHTHNQHAADATFGVGFMQAKRDGARARLACRPVAGSSGGAAPRMTALRAESGMRATWAPAGPHGVASPAPAGALASDPGRAPVRLEAPARAQDPAPDHTTDITNALRNLGARKDEIRHALECTAHLAHAPLKARLLMALRTLRPAEVKPLRAAVASASG